MKEDPFARFVEAQDPVIDRVLAELRAGRKQSHWMWFVFPQIAGLGASAMSQKYALASLEEAASYLAHAVLGQRLHDATGAVLEHIEETGRPNRSVHEIFGSPDDMKFHSSMTLFYHAAQEESAFKLALDAFFGGVEDGETLKRI